MQASVLTSALGGALVLAALGLPAVASAQDETAQAYPSRPIRMLLGVPPGGGTDVLARIVGNHLSVRFGQPVIIDNRPGAGHSIATGMVARARPDGHTLMMANANHTLNPFVYAKLPYDTVRDFAPVTQVVTQPLVLIVHPSFPATSVKDLIAMARASPGKLTAGIAGTAGAGAIAMEIFKRVSKTDFVIVPYKGGAGALLAVLQGEAQFFFASMTTGMGAIKSGKVKILATSSRSRLPGYADVPTLLESGLPGIDVTPWEGLLAPAGTPRAIISRLHAEIASMLKQPEVLARLSDLGSAARGSTPEEFAAEIRQQLELFGSILKRP